MTALEYVGKQIEKHTHSYYRAKERRAPAEELANIKAKIRHYCDAADALMGFPVSALFHENVGENERIEYEKNDVEYIKQYAIPADVAGQLAEEAAELAKAACKLERVIRGTNPTVVTYDEAVTSLAEEIADINVVTTVLLDMLSVPYGRVSDIEPEKFIRWAKRLRERYGDE